MLSEIASSNNNLILALTESHLHENINNAEISIDGYTSYRADRLGNLKGGIIVYIKNNWQSQIEVLDSGSINLIEYLVLYIKKINLIFITVYRSPSSDSQTFSLVMNKISSIVMQNEQHCPSIVLNGDFNFPKIKFEYGLIPASTQPHQILKNFADQFSLIQKINHPTRVNNILDLVFTNNDEIFTDFSVEDYSSLSDHRLIIGRTTLNYAKNDEKMTTFGNSFRTLNFYSENVNWVAINEELSKISWNTVIKSANMDLGYSELCKILFDICKNNAPKKKKITKSRIPRDRRILMKQRLSLKKRLVRSYGRRKSEILRNLESIQLQIAESHKKEISNRERRAIEAIKTNVKYFFTYAKTLSKTKSNIGPFFRK